MKKNGERTLSYLHRGARSIIYYMPCSDSLVSNHNYRVYNPLTEILRDPGIRPKVTRLTVVMFLESFVEPALES